MPPNSNTFSDWRRTRHVSWVKTVLTNFQGGIKLTNPRETTPWTFHSHVIRSCSLKPRQIYERAGVKQTSFELESITKHLMTGPAETVSFVSLRPQCFPRQTLRVSGKQNSLCPLGPFIKALFNKTQGSQRGTWMDKTGEDWNGLNLGKFEKHRPTFFQIYISLYQNVIYKAGKSFSVVMWPWFCEWKTLALLIWRLELTINKIKQNYLKQRDLAPLIMHIF